MNIPTELDLANEIENAARKAIDSLFSEHPEKFYYISLITDGEGHCPFLSAWSEEALEAVLLEEENPEEARLELKWSYADSPYGVYGEMYFNIVQQLFEQRKSLREQNAESEFSVRINAMEQAIASLDKKGLFGQGASRLNVVINAEVMPPDDGNTKRALRLNPKEALSDWLQEIAEESE